MTATPTPPHARPRGLALGGAGARTGAMLLDLLIALTVLPALSNIYRAVAPNPPVMGSVPASTTLVMVIFWAYFVVTTALLGGTFGKLAMGLRVVTTGLERPDWTTVFFREVVGRVIVAATLGVGYAWAIVDPRKQGWHDKIADTLVVRRVALVEGMDPWTRPVPESPPPPRP